MTIEFRCPGCQKLLRTQAGTQGKQAKCPECGTVCVIPDSPAPDQPLEASPPRDPDFANAPSPASAEEANPYQSPITDSAQPFGSTTVRPAPIDLGQAFSTTWQIFKSNMGACIAGTMLITICSAFASGAAQLLMMPVGMSLDGIAFFVFWVFQQVVIQAISAFFYMGLILFMLRIARGGSAEFGLLFGAGPFFVYGAVVQIVITLAVLGGLVLFIIPGIIIALMLSQAMFVLVDQKTDIGGALKVSTQIMQGNKLTVFAIWLVGGVLSIVVALVTCFIGLLFVIPFISLLSAVVYLGVSGQKTAVDAAPFGSEQSFDAEGMQPT